jgi:hypothetical protein
MWTWRLRDFEGKEYVDPFQGDRAVDVDEVHGEHG